MNDKNNPSMYDRIMSVDGEELSWSGVLSVLEEMEKDIQRIDKWATGSYGKGLVDTKVCENGHTMKGIGFDDECPECEAPWKHPTDVQELSEVDMLNEAVKQTRTQVLNEVIRKIGMKKDLVGVHQGTNKYDSCYDDCITICNSVMK